MGLEKIRAELLIARGHTQPKEEGKRFREALAILGEQFDFVVVFMDVPFDNTIGKHQSVFLSQESNDATG